MTAVRLIQIATGGVCLGLTVCKKGEDPPAKPSLPVSPGTVNGGGITPKRTIMEQLQEALAGDQTSKHSQTSSLVHSSVRESSFEELLKVRSAMPTGEDYASLNDLILSTLEKTFPEQWVAHLLSIKELRVLDAAVFRIAESATFETGMKLWGAVAAAAKKTPDEPIGPIRDKLIETLAAKFPAEILAQFKNEKNQVPVSVAIGAAKGLALQGHIESSFQLLKSVSEESELRRGLSAVAEHYCQSPNRNLTQALSDARKTGLGEQQIGHFETIFILNWLHRDLNPSLTYIDTLAPGSRRDEMLAAAARAVSSIDSAAALMWAEKISDESLKVNLLMQLRNNSSAGHQ